MKVHRFHRHRYDYFAYPDGLDAICRGCGFAWTQLTLFPVAA